MWSINCFEWFLRLESSFRGLILTMLQCGVQCFIDVITLGGATRSVVNAITQAIKSNNRDWVENLLVAGMTVYCGESRAHV